MMCGDVECCVRLGCDGVVLGALDPAGEVDMGMMRVLIAAAGSLGVTFHRAIDVSADPGRTLEDVIALGCERVLTSGGVRARWRVLRLLRRWWLRQQVGLW